MKKKHIHDKDHQKTGVRKKRHEQKSKHVAQPSLYGFHAVYEAWCNPDRAVDTLYVTEQAYEGFQAALDKDEMRALHRPQPHFVDKAWFDRALPRGSVHQGIALLCSDVPEYDINDIIIRMHAKERYTICILDQVTDPHNVGAILRSASAFGVDAVIMQRRHAPVLDGVIAKTACGAVEHIPVSYVVNLARAIEALQEEHVFVVGLAEEGDHALAPTLRDAPSRVALVMGAEGPGIRRLVRDKCDALAFLPTQGRIRSLNVSNAAAVSFYTMTQLGE